MIKELIKGVFYAIISAIIVDIINSENERMKIFNFSKKTVKTVDETRTDLYS